MTSLDLLREFFKSGRKANGGYMDKNEQAENATARHLSRLTDAELIALRNSAYAFRAYIETERRARKVQT